jgi:naphthalene 1,2-dioxygenase ferredoxin component
MTQSMAQPQFQVAIQVSAVPAGQVCHVALAGHEIAIFNIDGEYFATSDRCTHMRARLSDGYVNAGVIECPLHFGKFDIRTGLALSAPCKQSLATYPIQTLDGAIWVGLPANP